MMHALEIISSRTAFASMDSCNLFDSVQGSLEEGDEEKKQQRSVSASLKAYAKKAKPLSQHDKLQRDLIDLLKRFALDWSQELANDLPKKWKIVTQDLLILPPNCFTLSTWKLLPEEDAVWKTVASCFRVNRVAQENRVKSDDYRTPSLNLLLGNDPVVVAVNNDIK